MSIFNTFEIQTVTIDNTIKINLADTFKLA